MVAVDAGWAWQAGFTITHWLKPVSEIAMIWIVATLYLRVRTSPRLTEMLNYVVLWLSFSTAAAVLTYLSATPALPLQDRFYSSVDQAMHFDLAGYTRLLCAHHIIIAVLQLDYSSLLIQISFTVLCLAHTRTEGRNAAFLACSMLSLFVTCIGSALLPALGPSLADNPSLQHTPDYVGEILAMRSGLPVTRAVEELQGIVCFPSYHTVLAVLIAWAHRNLPTFWPVACVNALMLLAVPTVGNHYLADVLGGAAVSVVSIAAVGRLARAFDRYRLQPTSADHGLMHARPHGTPQ